MSATTSSMVELQSIPSSPTGSDPENPRSVIDPFSLSSSIKSEEEITTLTARHRKNASSRWPYSSGRLLVRGAVTIADPQAPRVLPKVEQKIDVKGIKEFYESQNESIQLLLKPVEDHVREAKEELGDTRLRYLIAVNGSFCANILLAVLQVYGAIASGSLSLFTTMADSIFDPLSNLLLILSHRASNNVDANRFPSGKARLETAGNIIFCFIMCAVSLILIVMSARDIAAHNGSENTTDFHLASIIAVGVAFATKLSLFLYCWSLRNAYSQVRILWEDHRNDLFINGFGILTSVGGSKLRWWIDPSGAIALSLLIAVLWSRTAYGEFLLLIGVSADNSMLRLITYISMTHSEHITQIDTVRAYHSGPRIIVEVDIVMCPSASLRITHDVAEELQIKLESLPGVERAYVHVDYETSHKPEHFLKKEL